MTNITAGRGPDGTQVQRSPGFNVPAKPEGRPLGAATEWYYPTQQKYKPLIGNYPGGKAGGRFEKGHFNEQDARGYDPSVSGRFEIGQVSFPFVVAGVFETVAPLGFRFFGVSDFAGDYAGAIQNAESYLYPSWSGPGHGITQDTSDLVAKRTGPKKVGTHIYYQVFTANSTYGAGYGNVVELGLDLTGKASVRFTGATKSVGLNIRSVLGTANDLYHGEFCVIEGTNKLPGIIETWFKDTYK